MSEVLDVYLNDISYGLTNRVSEWLNVSSVSSLRYSVYCSVNCDVRIEWAFDNGYQITETDIYPLTAGNSISIPKNIEKRFARFSVINIASNPCDLKCQLFYSNDKNSATDVINVGGFVELFKAEDLEMRTIQSSNGSITITQNTNNIDLIANIPIITLGSTGTTGSISLINDGIGAELWLKGLTGGTGIDLTVDNNNIAINSSVVNLGSTGLVGSVSLISDGTGPGLWLKGLTGANGTYLTYDNNNITINTPETTLTSVSSGGQSLVSDGSGPTLSVKGLKPGTNMALIIDANDLTLVNTMQNTTVGSTGLVGSVSLIADGTGPELWLKGLTGGAGVSMAYNNNNITVSSTVSGTIVLGSGKNITATESPVGTYTLAVGTVNGLASTSIGLRGDTDSSFPNNIQSVMIGAGNAGGGNANGYITFVGYAAGASIGSNRDYASGFGNNSLRFGSRYGTAVGGLSLYNCVDYADHNTALGYRSGYNNSNGYRGVYIGSQSANGSTTANDVIVCGYNCCASGTIGAQSQHYGSGCASNSTAGSLNFGASMEAVKTTATAGVNGAPPAQVSAYIPITYNGTSYRIPVYNP